ncbi:MAG: hypothetical protein FJX77_01435 [Armatimonadetes bacterium]|nr:hypothetical protein [Armatimonadota bacterium]
MEDAHSLAHCLATYSIVAWRLVCMMYQARVTPDAPPTTVFTEREVQVLAAESGRPVGMLELAVREGARLGGYAYYQGKRLPPGVPAMWRGLQRLEALVCGWGAALRSLPAGGVLTQA